MPALCTGSLALPGECDLPVVARDFHLHCAYVHVHMHVDVQFIRAFLLQWTPSNLATLRTNLSVLIRGVASFQGQNFIKFVL